MHYYTTLFDSYYLSRGILMYESLKRYTSDFHLFIFAFDQTSYRILKSMDPEKTTVISLEEFETEELKRVKKERTVAEYCWTCTPSVIYHVLEKYSVPECTYIDSDLLFYADPAVLISELDRNGKNVLITEHRYSWLAALYAEKRSGRFCVQFMTFRNEENSLNVLQIWRDQCIGWCFARHEDGKFGDQKYLDEWPDKYGNVHVLENAGGGIAPWNLLSYSFRKKNLREKSSGAPVNPVFYHFQYVRCLSEGVFDVGWYPIPPRAKKLFYLPYLGSVETLEKKLSIDYREYVRKFADLKLYISGNLVKRFLKGTMQFNIMKTKWLT